MKQILATGVLVALLLAAGSAEELATVAVPHPHGDVHCASGCSLSNHPTPELSPEEFRRLAKAYQAQPPTAASPPLEELLYYGIQSVELLEQLGPSGLDRAHLAFLTRQLKRNRCRVEFRILDEKGQVRVWMPAVEVALDQRHIFRPLKVKNFQPPEASGTVKRVGLEHVWQRI